MLNNSCLQGSEGWWLLTACSAGLLGMRGGLTPLSVSHLLLPPRPPKSCGFLLILNYFSWLKMDDVSLTSQTLHSRKHQRTN